MTFDWLKAQQGQPEPSTEGGSSGYLSAPAATLDPDLFNGMVMKPEVRNFIYKTLTGALNKMGLLDVTSWLHLWVIGSSMSYQWAEQRGHGDIDVTFSADMGKFDQANPGYANSAAEAATAVKRYIKANVAPGTAHKMFGGHAYEVTFFWNPDLKGDDLSSITPYAAYDIIGNKWAVKPIELPNNPATLYPKEWFERADEDAATARKLVHSYRNSQRLLQNYNPGTPGHINAGAHMNLVTAQAQAMLDDLHHGRMIAFQGGGSGYTDWHNFRWQRAKASGAAKGLTEITGVSHRAQEMSETELYGHPLEGADELLRRAQSIYKDHS